MNAPEFSTKQDDALVIVDPQNDFCPGGALAVPGGESALADIANLVARFPLVVVTQDWHPAGHKSFASSHAGAAPFSLVTMPYGEQVLWPDHCIQGTYGADFHPLAAPAVARAQLIVRKGHDPEVDSYSAFFENDRRTTTGLAGYLRDKGVRRCVFVGLAYDFCVAWSAIDAVSVGFEGVVLKRFTRGIAMPVADGGTTEDLAERRFREVGVTLVA